MGFAVGRGPADRAMTRHPSARRHIGRLLRATRAVVPTCTLVLLACASHRIPGLHGYSIVVEEKDQLSVELAQALRDQGVKVRGNVKGGSGPTAALIYFTFRYPAPDEPTWFHLRLADTRTGVVVRASTIELDSTTVTARDRARAAIQALLAP